MAYDASTPNKKHQGLLDVPQTRENLNQLRCNERGTVQPSNPVAGMWWADESGAEIVMGYRNKANDGYRIIDFPKDTEMVFVQAAAPPGWIQIVTDNNIFLRVVATGGGGTGGTEPFVGGSVEGHALTEAETGPHSHAPPRNASGEGEYTGFVYTMNADLPPTYDWSTNEAGDGVAHVHDIDFAYRDVIICKRDA